MLTWARPPRKWPTSCGREAHQAFGDAADVHDLAGEDEQRDRDQRELVDAEEDLLRHDLDEGGLVGEEQGGDRRRDQGEHDRYAERHQGDQDPEIGERHRPAARRLFAHRGDEGRAILLDRLRIAGDAPQRAQRELERDAEHQSAADRDRDENPEQ